MGLMKTVGSFLSNKAMFPTQKRDLLLRSLVHEAWYRWHEGLSSGVSSSHLDTHTAHAPCWNETFGPARLHFAMGSVFATAVSWGAPTPVAEQSAKSLQLKLAARQLRRQASAAGEAQQSAASGADWTAAASLACSTVLAHLPSLPLESSRQQVVEALHWLAGLGRQDAQQPGAAQWTLAMNSALRDSDHLVFLELLEPVLMPALQALGERYLAPAVVQVAGVHELAASDTTGEASSVASNAFYSLIGCYTAWKELKSVPWAQT